ncbi:MAG TPA: hypothetical protein PKW11_07540 [Pseudomonadota bacterium]|nr:hypothetical protein [Pseudomonadota bacterium]
MDGLAWLQRFSRSRDRLKLDVQLATDEARQQLERAGAEAAMYGPFDDGGYVIYFRSAQPTASAVLEEFAHVLQDRKKHFSKLPLPEMVLRREIEAHECLDEHADTWSLPPSEREQTMGLLQQDRDNLDKLASWG